VRKGLPVIACLVTLLAAGCARKEDNGTPAGCSAGEDAVVRALAKAPGDVRVEGTRLSSCLTDTSDGGELTAVGSSYVSAAVRLADAAVKDPEGDAALQLGYLLGAVKRSERGSQGVGTELERRMESEATRLPHSRALARGRRAGRARG
jgi:hypothetical protein